MSFSVFEKIDPSCQNGSMEKAKNLPYHQRPYASIAARTLVDISIYSPRPQIAGTGHSHSKISIHSPRAGRDCRYPNAPLITQISIHSPHTGRDLADSAVQGHACGISIHSPRMGRDSKRTQLFEEKNWRICTTLYLFASKEVLPADKKLFREKKQTVFFGANRTGKPWELPYRTNH